MWNIWPFGRKSEPAEQRSMTIDEFLAMAGIPNTGSGEYVSAGTAESLPAVMNAVSVISEAVATMPCYLYRVRNDNGREAREWLSNHPVDFLLNEQPNVCQTPYQFKRTMMRHCLLNGNAYAVIQWGRDGQPQSLHPYAPGAVVPERIGEHKYKYTITEPFTGAVRTYLQEEILHLRYSTDDGFLGRSPITICREALGLGLAQQRHGASIMKDGMMAAGVITAKEWLDGVKGKSALEALERYKGARNAGKTPILEGGMDYKQLGMSNQDAEWLASRRFTIEDIARMFNVSPIFLQEDGRHVEHAGYIFDGETAGGQPLGILIAHAKLFVVHTPFEDRRFPCIPCAFVALQRLKCTFAFNAIQPFFSGNDARRHHAIFHNAGTMALLGQT